MNTEQQTTQTKQHRYTQDNTDIHKTTQISCINLEAGAMYIITAVL
jgi:hypothetical protein